MKFDDILVYRSRLIGGGICPPGRLFHVFDVLQHLTATLVRVCDHVGVFRLNSLDFCVQIALELVDDPFELVALLGDDAAHVESAEEAHREHGVDHRHVVVVHDTIGQVYDPRKVLIDHLLRVFAILLEPRDRLVDERGIVHGDIFRIKHQLQHVDVATVAEVEVVEHLHLAFVGLFGLRHVFVVDGVDVVQRFDVRLLFVVVVPELLLHTVERRLISQCDRIGAAFDSLFDRVESQQDRAVLVLRSLHQFFEILQRDLAGEFGMYFIFEEHVGCFCRRWCRHEAALPRPHKAVFL